MMRWLKVQQVRLAFIGEAVRDYLARVEAVERVQGPPSVRGVAVTLVNPNGTPTADEVRRIAARLGVTTEAAVEAASTAATGAGRTVETTAQHAPRPNDWQEGPTPVLGGLMSRIDDHGSSSVFSAVPAVWGYGLTPGATVRDYAHSLTDPYEIMQRYVDDWPSMPMRSLSNDNYDRVWIAQGDHIEAMGVGDTPQEAAIEYARAVADLLRPTGGPDALDSKQQIRAQLAACRGECGDGPCGCPDYSEWSR